MENLNTPQELVKGIYWLGIRRNVRLESNTYLLLFDRKDGPLPLLIDPGGPNVSRFILKRLQDILNELGKLRLIFLSDHAPGVGINIARLLKQNPALKVICTDDVWRLAYALGVSSVKFQAVEKFNNARVRLSKEQVIHFLPIPFCPSRGSCMLYDEQNRILFSGGLFGGIMFTLSLFATPEHWEGIRMWHQMYIPSPKSLQNAIKLVRNLQPAPKIIAPQYGAILKGDMIPMVLDKLSAVPVGADLPQATDIDKVMYIEAINEVLTTISEKAGKDVIDHLLRRLDEDLSFPRLFTVKQGQLIDIKNDILGDVMGSFKMLLYALIQDQPQDIQEIIRNAILQSNWNLPMFMQTFVSRKRS
jgi:glyoxylase-like metal-dependent hydrolase (beta-lactamase superfamily II)